jgi:hypothetical protein
MVYKQAWSIKNYRYVWDVSGFRFMRAAWALADSTASDRNRRQTRIYPGSAPWRVKTYILLV